MGKLKYSFIIPVYNCEKYLKDCIDSIQAQEMEDNYEILLIDDGAIDRSGELCDQYAANYDYISVYHKQNGGASSARNYGLEKARGEYILFIDGDDTIALNMMKTLDTLLNDTEIAVYGMSFDYYQKNQLVRTEVLSYPENEILTSYQIGQRINQLFLCNSLSSACNKVFLRKIIVDNKIRFNEEMTLYEDFDFVLQYMRYIKNAVFCNQGFYHYRLDADNNHLQKRVSDLDRLIMNLDCLGNSIFETAEMLDCVSDCKELYGKLYLQLVYRHLLFTKEVSVSAKKVCEVYQNNVLLKQSLDTDMQLNKVDTRFLKLLKESESNSLTSWIYERRVHRCLRLVIKNILTIIGAR